MTQIVSSEMVMRNIARVRKEQGLPEYFPSRGKVGYTRKEADELIKAAQSDPCFSYKFFDEKRGEFVCWRLSDYIEFINRCVVE